MEKFDFQSNLILEDDVVLLRPLRSDDLENLLPFLLGEPNLWTYSLISAAGSENLIKYIKTALKERIAERSYPFIVFDKRVQKYAGCTRFYDYQDQHKTTQLGYTWYGKEFQGSGLNKHCKFLLLRYAFEKLGLARVEFRADANNNRSIAAMKRIGCTVEGILRSNCKSQTGRRDSIILSILESEWYKNVKRQLSEQLS